MITKNVPIPAALHERLKIVVARKGIFLQQFVADAIEKLVAFEEKKDERRARVTREALGKLKAKA